VDASPYGIGGCLYQQYITGDKTYKHVVMFVNKCLSGAQLAWHMMEKEAYAIFYCLKKLEFLIRDVNFILRTDHRNLTFMKSGTSDKVLRWKLYVQEFNFTLEHIPGVDNILADTHSRLVNYTAANTLDVDVVHTMMMAEEFAETRIPREFYSQISNVHNRVNGHHGVLTTLQKLGELDLHWPDREKHVRAFIAQCPICQKNDPQGYNVQVIPYTVAGEYPFQKIALDSLSMGRTFGPSRTGYSAVLVITCLFSRFVELYPIRKIDGESIAPLLVRYFGRYGHPDTIVSDQGPEFHNNLIKELMTITDVDYKYTFQHSHQESAIIERVNREVRRHWRNWLTQKPITNTIVQCLPIMQRILNTTVNSSTGYAPSRLVFGNTAALDRNIFFPMVSRRAKEGHTYTMYAITMMENQHLLLEQARETQRMIDADNLSKRFDAIQQEVTQGKKGRRVLPHTFALGSYVLVTYPKDSNDFRGKAPSKFHPVHRGPFRVLHRDGDYYTLLDSNKGTHLEVHARLLRPFIFDPEYTIPEKVAAVDRDMYFVERILAHKGNPNKKSTMYFHVKWVDYEDEKDLTWEPYENLRTNSTLHDYLRESGDPKLLSLIPQQFR